MNWPGRRRYSLALLVCLSLLVADARPALAYLKLGVRINGRQTTLKWTKMPVPYFVTERSAAHVGPAELQAAIGRAFSTWEGVPTASVSYQFAGYTEALPLQVDGLSTLGFVERPDLDRVLASTSLLVDSETGALVESDIFFNAAFDWSVAAGGESGRYDLETVALHEIGHMSGLGHSALGETELRAGGGRRVMAAESIMFPIAFAAGNVSGRTLRADDVAGLSDLYPDNGFNQKTGSISGLITKGGQGLYGAHVVAFDLAAGTLVAGFSLDAQGEFSIAGLSPGPHVVRVEPLDDVDTAGFFELGTVDLDFRVTFFGRLVVVPRGGDSGSVEVRVASK